jgi:hypothetical protein
VQLTGFAGSVPVFVARPVVSEVGK